MILTEILWLLWNTLKYCWLSVHCSVHLQTHGPGPKGKQRRRLLQNTFLCTGRKQCWRQSQASSVSRSASLHRPTLARTGCSKATCNYALSREKGQIYVVVVSILSNHRNNEALSTCRSLRLYCSHREGSPFQPKRKGDQMTAILVKFYAHRFVTSYLERLVNTWKKVFTQFWYLQSDVTRRFLFTSISANNHQVYQVWEVLLNLLRWQSPHQVEGTVKLLFSHSFPGQSLCKASSPMSQQIPITQRVDNRVRMDFIIQLVRY